MLVKRAVVRRLFMAGIFACVIAAGGVWIYFDRKSPINLDSYPLVEAQAIKQSLYIAQPFGRRALSNLERRERAF